MSLPTAEAENEFGREWKPHVLRKDKLSSAPRAVKKEGELGLSPVGEIKENISIQPSPPLFFLVAAS
jgi:hypothetical protein